MATSVSINFNTSSWLAALDKPGANRDAVLFELVRAVVDGARPLHDRQVRDEICGVMLPQLKALEKQTDRNLEKAYAMGFAEGRKAGLASGRIELNPSPELIEALRPVPQAPPVVRVAAPNVTVENTVVVPARKVVARPQKDGSVEMTPVDESTR